MIELHPNGTKALAQTCLTNADPPFEEKHRVSVVPPGVRGKGVSVIVTALGVTAEARFTPQEFNQFLDLLGAYHDA